MKQIVEQFRQIDIGDLYGGGVAFVMVLALIVQGLLASAQEPLKPVPDAMFQQAEPTRVLSVFGDSFPSPGPQQVLVQTHMYVACVDTNARQPAWVAFRVERSDWDTENILERNFTTPPEMRRICLEPSDFRKSGYELGHLYALQFAAACDRAYEVNYMCAVAAQRSNLNQGPWLKAEKRIKDRSLNGAVKVIAGQLWRQEMPRLRLADEEHAVASDCWIIAIDDTGTEAYLFPQNCRRDAELSEFGIEPAALRAMVAPRWTAQPTEERR